MDKTKWKRPATKASRTKKRKQFVLAAVALWRQKRGGKPNASVV